MRNDSDLVTEVRELRAEVAALRGRLEERPNANEAEADAEASAAARVGSAPLDGGWSRRRFFTTAGAVAAGGVASAVLAAAPASAGVDGDVVLGAANSTATKTSITSSALDAAFAVTNSGTTDGDMTGFKAFANAPGAIAMVGNSTALTAATIGVQGAVGSTLGIGVQGTNSGTGGVGIEGAGNGTGSIGVNGFGDIGVNAIGTTFGLLAEGTSAPIRLVPAGSAGAPGSGDHSLGELRVDSNGVLLQCVVAGTPGTWVAHKPFVPLASPSRVYDSRAGQPNPSGSTQGKLAFGAGARTINCSPAVPAGATTMLFNLAVTGTAGASAGALLMWAAGATEPLASSINWTSAGQTVANSVTSACDASQDVQVKCVASAGSSTNLILDVIGYYR